MGIFSAPKELRTHAYRWVKSVSCFLQITGDWDIWSDMKMYILGKAYDGDGTKNYFQVFRFTGHVVWAGILLLTYQCAMQRPLTHTDTRVQLWACGMGCHNIIDQSVLNAMTFHSSWHQGMQRPLTHPDTRVQLWACSVCSHIIIDHQCSMQWLFDMSCHQGLTVWIYFKTDIIAILLRKQWQTN